jgi:hypothetical protein
MADRGQAEVLGYLLVFSLIVLAVAMVTVSGQAGLADLRDDQRTTNAERGFAVLADNVDDVVRGVPSRATELELSGEQLSLGEPVTVNVTATNSSGVVFERVWSIRPVVFRAPDGAALVYESGAVVRRGERGGAVVVREPRWVLSENRTVLPVVNTTRDSRGFRGNPASVDRESRVLVRTERRAREVVAASEQRVTLTITVDSPRAAAWEPFLERAIDPDTDVCSSGGGTVSCSYATDHATVVGSRIAVGFE